jgi:hypothetical protein
MEGPLIIGLLAVQGVLFAFWGYWMLRCLFKLRRAAIAETGSGYPGLRATLRQFGLFARAPEHQRDRRILIVLTGVLLLLSALFGRLATVGGAG